MHDKETLAVWLKDGVAGSIPRMEHLIKDFEHSGFEFNDETLKFLKDYAALLKAHILSLPSLPLPKEDE